MKLSSLPLVNEDVISRLTKDKAFVISTNRIEGYILENIVFDIWKLIDGNNVVKDIISLCFKKISKKEIIKTLKDLEELKLIYFK